MFILTRKLLDFENNIFFLFFVEFSFVTSIYLPGKSYMYYNFDKLPVLILYSSRNNLLQLVTVTYL